MIFLYIKWVAALKIGILRRAKDGVYMLKLNIYSQFEHTGGIRVYSFK